MGSQEDGPAPTADVAPKRESEIASDEPAAKRARLDQEVEVQGEVKVEPVMKEEKPRVNGYATIKEEYVKMFVLGLQQQL